MNYIALGVQATQTGDECPVITVQTGFLAIPDEERIELLYRWAHYIKTMAVEAEGAMLLSEKLAEESEDE